MPRYDSNDPDRNARAARKAISKGERRFEGAYLNGANLRGAQLFRADLRRANLRSALLGEANCTEVDFERASLQSAQCIRSNFRSANLKGADLADAYFAEASFTLLDWRGNPCFDEYTRWPTDEKAYFRATLDGKPFLETVAFYRAVAQNQDPEFRAGLHALHVAQQKQEKLLAMTMNSPGASIAAAFAR